MTIAVNQGYVIARSEKALHAWTSRREARTPRSQTVAQYRATAARLAARLPGNVKVN